MILLRTGHDVGCLWPAASVRDDASSPGCDHKVMSCLMDMVQGCDNRITHVMVTPLSMLAHGGMDALSLQRWNNCTMESTWHYYNCTTARPHLPSSTCKDFLYRAAYKSGRNMYCYSLRRRSDRIICKLINSNSDVQPYVIDIVFHEFTSVYKRYDEKARCPRSDSWPNRTMLGWQGSCPVQCVGDPIKGPRN